MPSPKTTTVVARLEADRKSCILRLLDECGPLSIALIRMSIAQLGHAYADHLTMVGDLAALEQNGQVKITDDRLMVEFRKQASCADAQLPPVPILIEFAEDQGDHAPEQDQHDKQDCDAA